MKLRKIGSVVIITNGNFYTDTIGVFLEDEGELLVYNREGGEFDYLIRGVDLDEAEDIVDLLNNEPSDTTWEKYNLNDEDVYCDFEGYFGDLESYADGLRHIGAIPSSAEVFTDPQGLDEFDYFITHLMMALMRLVL